MLKKLVSVLLSMIMIASLLTTGVMAAGNLTIDSFNATLSKVMIDMAGVSGDIDGASLDGKIELYKRNADGSETAVAFTAKASETKYDTKTSTTAVSDGTTIVVAPVGGFTADELYRVILKAGIADDAGNSVASDISTGYFSVNVIASDDFNVKFDDNGNLASPYVASTGIYAGSYVSSNNWVTQEVTQDLAGISLVGGEALSTAEELAALENPDTKLVFKGGSDSFAISKTLRNNINDAGKECNNWTIEYDYTFGDTPASHKILLMGENLISHASPYLQDTNASGFVFDTDNTASLWCSTDGKASQNALTVPASAFGSTMKVTASLDAVNNYTFKLYADNDKLFDVAYTPKAFNKAYITSLYGGGMSAVDNFTITSCSKLGVDVFANELTLGNVNATTSVVTVDLNGVTNSYVIDEETLAGKIKLYKMVDGQDVECAVSSIKVSANATGKDANGNEALISKGNTVTLIPEGGVTPNIPYKVKLTSGIADTSPVAVSLKNDAESPYFYVKVLYSSDFDIAFDAENNLCTPYASNDGSRVYSKDWTMNGRMSISKSGNSSISTLADMANGDDTAFATFSGNYGFAVLGNEDTDLGSDYTVEYSYKLPGTTMYVDRAYHKAGLRGGGINANSHKGSTGFRIYGKDSPSNNNAYIALSKGDNSNGETDIYITASKYSFAGSTVNIRVSGIGSNFKMFADNEKLFDVNYDGSAKGGSFSFIDAAQSAANLGGTPSEIDDVVITRTVMLANTTDKVVLTLVSSDDLTEELIDVKVSALNLAYSGDFKVFFAAYNNQKALVDAKIGDSDFGTGESGEFDARLNNSKGDISIIKVFAWGAETLEPLGELPSEQ